MSCIQTEIMNVAYEIFTVVENQETICRLCGKQSWDAVSIFDENLCVAEKISRCLPIIILSTDKLPSHVCKYCLHSLDVSYKLILTSTEIDLILRNQHANSDVESSSETEEVASPSESETIAKSKSSRNLSIRELKRRAIAGPAECEICDVTFKDVDAFDEHMELHFLRWKCNLCDKSFHTSTELISHKTLNHHTNIIICKACVYSKKQENESTLETESIAEHCVLDVQNVYDCNSDLEPTRMESETKVLESDGESESSEPPKPEQSSKTIKKRIGVPVAKKFNKQRNNFEFLCDDCKICFGDEHHYIAHKRIHETKQITCSSCRIDCSSIYELFLHKRTEHNMYKQVQLKYVCDKCGKFFTNNWQWQSHAETDCLKKKSETTCKYCEIKFSTGHKLQRHLRKHKSEMMEDPTVIKYKCVGCPKIFVDKEFYQQHRNVCVHDPECWDKYKCSICDRSFRDNVRLKEHQLFVHEGVKPHECDVCGRSFLRSYNMKIHRITHFGHSCTYCDKNFRTVRYLLKHIKDIHGIEPDNNQLVDKSTYANNIYICTYCGKRLASYQSLINHEYIHTGEKPYKCKICQKAFRNYTTRWAHTQRHKEGKYICEYCGKSIRCKPDLTIHMRTHRPVEDRKHHCTVCGKRFLRKCHLRIHMRIHNGIRPYSCDICRLTFTQQGDMRRHRMRHSKGNIRSRSNRCKPPIKNEERAQTEEST